MGRWMARRIFFWSVATFKLFRELTYTFIVCMTKLLLLLLLKRRLPIPSNSSLTVVNLVPKTLRVQVSNDGNVSFDVTNSSVSAIDFT
jgi:hypothetical protein